MNLRVPRITHTELSYDKALLPEARVTGLILNDIRKVVPGGLLPPWTPIFVKFSIFSYQIRKNSRLTGPPEVSLSRDSSSVKAGEA